MTLIEKRELVELLNIYQRELLSTKRLDKYGNYIEGTKAQYEHARIIANKIAREIGKEI